MIKLLVLLALISTTISLPTGIFSALKQMKENIKNPQPEQSSTIPTNYID